MNHLFSPCTLGNLQLKNRIVIALMCQYSAVKLGATAEAPPQYWRGAPQQGLFNP